MKLLGILVNRKTLNTSQKYKHNPRYLSSVEFELNKINLTNDIAAAVNSADILILAVPSAFCHDTLKSIAPDALQNKIIFSAIKGIIPEHNLIVGEYLNTIWNVALKNIGVITGPCHAEGSCHGKIILPHHLHQETLKKQSPLQKSMRCRYIKVTASDDIYGTEISAVLKNVVAVAGGICHGLGYGDNFLSVLVSNAIQEIERFVKAVHPIDRDIKASAYLGDLLVTAYSQFSRNRMFGTMLGKGYSVKMAQLEMNMICRRLLCSKVCTRD
jgi:glycerol-3-phosphate dehydrogenase (NAD(P)+)